VVSKFMEVEYKPAEVIVQQGDVGDCFYIVKEGVVECIVDGKLVKKVGTGGYFGERALLRDEPRAADCIARGHCVCVALKREDFNSLLGPLGPLLDQNMIKDALRTASIFRFLTAFEREDLLEQFQHTKFEAGEIIFKQGEEGTSFVLIREGAVKCYINNDGGEKTEVAHLKSGQYVGERSLLYNEPRKADVVVCTDVCYCAFLDNAGFEKCLGPIADVMKRATLRIEQGKLRDITVLGVGTFGTVKLVQDRESKAVYAMKIISKLRVVQYSQQEHIITEKQILAEIDHPFCVKLHTSFKDTQSLFMVLDYCPGGELFNRLKKERMLPEEQAVFYSASVMLAFEYLHDLNIIYRDLKPENLLLDQMGFIKIVDFGFAKYIKDHTWTLCGTPEYLAPETIRNKGHGKGVDWWGLGILTYEMLHGGPPYQGDTPMQTYKAILEGELTFPASASSASKDLIRRLLHPSAGLRLGCLRNGSSDVRLHKFFSVLDTHALLRGKVTPPYKPEIKSITDTSYFDEFEEQIDEDYYVDDGSGWDEMF